MEEGYKLRRSTRQKRQGTTPRGTGEGPGSRTREGRVSEGRVQERDKTGEGPGRKGTRQKGGKPGILYYSSSISFLLYVQEVLSNLVKFDKTSWAHSMHGSALHFVDRRHQQNHQ